MFHLRTGHRRLLSHLHQWIHGPACEDRVQTLEHVLSIHHPMKPDLAAEDGPEAEAVRLLRGTGVFTNNPAPDLS